MSFTGQIKGSDDVAVQIAEYVCGLLPPDEHAAIHELLSRDDDALAQALAWEERLLTLVDGLPRARPEPALRERLQRTLGIGPPPAPQPPPQLQLLRQRSAAVSAPPGAQQSAPNIPKATSRPAEAERPAHAHAIPTKPAPVTTPTAMEASERTADPTAARRLDTPSAAVPDATEPDAQRGDPVTNERADRDRTAGGQRRLVRKLWVWRLISLCAISAAIVGFMLPGEPPPPPVQIIKVAPTRAAILQAPGTSSTPGWTATLDAQGNLMMQPLVHTEVPTGSKAVLWTRSATVPEPRLLAQIDPNRPLQIPAVQLGALADDQLLEITLERDADAAKGVANGPILFIGQMTVFGSAAAASEAPGGGSATGGPIVQGATPR